MKDRTKKILKISLEVLGSGVLLAIIIVLVIQNKDIFAKNKENNAKDKLDTAIKVQSTSENKTLLEAINEVDGVEKIEADEKNGEYKVEIDGEQFVIVTQEIIFDE